MPTAIDDLKNKAYKTAKARFNAATRIESRQKSLVHFITFLTSIQIAASIALLTASNHPYASLGACISISFSVFIAIISNSDSISKDVLHAHLLHKCGMDLMRLHDKIKADTKAEDNTVGYTEEYSNIINDCSLNHDSVDFHNAENQINPDRYKWSWLMAKFKTYRLVLSYILYTVALSTISYIIISASNKII